MEFAGHALRVRLPGRLQCCCSGLGGRVRGLTDRRAECGVLDGLVEAVCAGESRVLVVHGEPGIGKTALLDYLASSPGSTSRGSSSRCRLPCPT